MWQRLFDKKIYLVVPKDARILNRPDLSVGARNEMLARAQISADAAEKALDSIDTNRFENTVIDLKRLLSFQTRENSPPQAATLNEQMMLSRVKLQGTDGMRGNLLADHLSTFEALTLYLRERKVVPALFELAAHSLASLLLETKSITEEDTCTFGEDGRDMVTKGQFAQAVIRGFNLEKIKVYNTGVLATPGVILYAAYAQSRIAAILTASHNPANQNGLKFTFDGFKLLEESHTGEYALTATMFRLANGKPPPAGKRAVEQVSAAAEQLLIETNLANSWLRPGELDNVRVVYDGANGAYSLTASKVLERLHIAHVDVNTTPLGHNINQGGGVAELEGKAFFTAGTRQQEENVNPAAVERIFQLGQKHPGLFVCGIVNDGDGDRGYLLVYNAEMERVSVLSGDELAIWIAIGMRERGEVTPDSVFVASIESDLLVRDHARFKLDLQTEVACVGDKWLLEPVRRGRKFVVGVEESGHVTFASEIVDRAGRPLRVFTGNGLLSALRVLSVLNRLEPDTARVVHPFQPGVKDSRSVYFVDKSRFYPGSQVWQEDIGLIRSQLCAHLPKALSAKQVAFDHDPSMLYFDVADRAAHSVAAIFIRNSGTEDKIVVTIRGKKELEELLSQTMLEIHHHHLLTMKDRECPDAIKEGIVVRLLGKQAAPLTVLKSNLEKELGSHLSQVDFHALIYAMRKQNFVILDREVLRLAAPDELN